MKIKRPCDNCTKTYIADTRDLNRGWGKCCSKSCAASAREKSKPGYDPKRVEANNIRREAWNDGGKVSGYTSEGYRIIDGVAYDKFDEPIYDVDTAAGDYDPGDSEYWDSKDY